MHVHILTIFPEVFNGFLGASLIAKAQEKGLLKVTLVNFRDFADPPHFHVDDTPYGGGPGMVLKPEPIIRAIRKSKETLPGAKVILLTPAGPSFKQSNAVELSKMTDLIFICGRYEGVDQRVIDLEVDYQYSIGDFVVMGGEVPTMLILEACVRLLDNAIGNKNSLQIESFGHDVDGKQLLEAPQYTKPAEFEGLKVPDVLLSGNHSKIEAWRRSKALEITKTTRPDLLQ